MTVPSYIQPATPIYQHRDGKGANRIRFLAWKDSVEFFRRLWIHQGFGACLNKNWLEPCPICDQARRQLDRGAGFRTLVKQGIMLGKNPRILAQIIDRKDEKEGVQVWDVSGSEIEIAIRNLSVDKDTGLIVPWTDPDYGCDLIYDYDSRESHPGPRNLKRSWQSKLDRGLYDGVMDFDEDIIKKPTYEEMAGVIKPGQSSLDPSK